MEYRFEWLACIALSLPIGPAVSRRLEAKGWFEPARMAACFGVFALALLALVSTTFNPFIYFRF